MFSQESTLILSYLVGSLIIRNERPDLAAESKRPAAQRPPPCHVHTTLVLASLGSLDVRVRIQERERVASVRLDPRWDCVRCSHRADGSRVSCTGVPSTFSAGCTDDVAQCCHLHVPRAVAMLVLQQGRPCAAEVEIRHDRAVEALRVDQYYARWWQSTPLKLRLQ